MKILITGASGLLGKSLIETMPTGHAISATFHANWYIRRNVADWYNYAQVGDIKHTNEDEGIIWYYLDIKNRSDVFDRFELIRPDAVIHCASIGGVDYSEVHYEETREVNVGGLRHVIDAANGYKSNVVYISTNAVYSGKQPPYDENSPLEPVNAYGVIKREAERFARDTAQKWLIIRPFMLYGWPTRGARTNWAVKIIKVLRKGGRLSLVDDVIWQPTYAPDCAKAIWDLLLEKERGNQIYNVASPERATLYQFGLQICDVFGLDKDLLAPVKSAYFNIGEGVVAKRPKDTTYDLLKLSKEGIMLSDLKTGLEKMRESE